MGFIIDGNETIGNMAQDASGLPYDNTTSGLTAENVQSAIDELSTKKIDVDDTLSDTSENPVQNKVIKAKFDSIITKSLVEITEE